MDINIRNFVSRNNHIKNEFSQYSVRIRSAPTCKQQGDFTVNFRLT